MVLSHLQEVGGFWVPHHRGVVLRKFSLSLFLTTSPSEVAMGRSGSPWDTWGLWAFIFILERFLLLLSLRHAPVFCV